MRNLWLLSPLFLLTACSYGLGIEVRFDGGNLVFAFHDCGSFFRSDVLVGQIDISDTEASLPPDTMRIPICSVKVNETSVWQYPSGAQTCPPLAVGRVYEIYASRPGRKGTRNFRLLEGGKLDVQGASCS